MKITRENLNSFDCTMGEMRKYFENLMSEQVEPTPLELLAMAHLSSISPSFKAIFESSTITKTDRHIFPNSFNEAMELYSQICGEHGSSSQEAMQQFMIAMQLAPDWFLDEAQRIVEESGLIPKPTKFTEDGDPVYTTKEIADHLGFDESEVLKGINKVSQIRTDIGLEPFEEVDMTQIHRIN